MSQSLSIQEILEQSEFAFKQLSEHGHQITEDHFFQQPLKDKWSIAQHVQHLIISTRAATTAYSLPKFLVRLVFGSPNRPSSGYDELVEKYLLKLKSGGSASGRYIPKSIVASTGKEKMIANWKKVTRHYLKALRDNGTDDKLEKYIVSHPLLGKITLRELGYFTLYHTLHHLRLIKEL